VRSLQANSLYWAWHIPIVSDWTGYTKDETHEVLKWLFLREKKTLPTGEEVDFVRSTTDLTVEEFSEYLRKIEQWAAEHGCFIPEAGRIEAR
jgi:hypothetical protein